MKKYETDFHRVAPEHKWIDEQLSNWARWSRDTLRIQISPGFRLYRPDNYDRSAPGKPIDVQAAQRVQAAIHGLGVRHRKALQWHYVAPVSPARRARELMTSSAGLHELVVEARTMLNGLLTRAPQPDVQFANA